MNTKINTYIIFLLIIFMSFPLFSDKLLINDYIKSTMLKEKAFYADSSFFNVLNGEKYFSLIDSSLVEYNIRNFIYQNYGNPFGYYILGEFFRISGSNKLFSIYYDSSLMLAAKSYGANLILYRYFKIRGNSLYALKTLNSIYDVSLNKGIIAHPLLCAYFKYKSIESIKSGNLIEATHYDNIAIKLNSSDLESYSIQSIIHQKTDPLNSLKDIALFIINAFSDFRNKIFVYSSLLRIAYLGLFYASFFFLTILYITNLDFLTKKISKLIKSENRFFYVILYILLLISPFIWFDNIVYIYIIFLVYNTYICLAKRKREFIFIALVLIIMIIPTIGDSVNFKIYSPDSEISAVLNLNVNPGDSNAREYINNLRVEDKNNTFIYNYLLGFTFKKNGILDSAKTYYKTAFEYKPLDVSLMNNIGNIFFLEKQYDSAFIYYTKGIKLDSTNAALHYNLAQYYQIKLQLNKSSEEIEEAYSLDFDKISNFSKNSTNHYNRILIDDNIPEYYINKLLSKYVFKDIHLYNYFLKVNVLPIAIIALLYIIILSILANKQKKLFPYKRCSVCGHWEYEKELDYFENTQLCRECNSRVVNVSNDTVKAKIIESLKTKYFIRRKTIGFFINLIIPGGGLIYLEKQGRGLIYLFQFIIYFMIATSSNYLITNTFTIPLMLKGIIHYIFIGLTVFIYVLIQLIYLSLKESEFHHA